MRFVFIDSRIKDIFNIVSAFTPDVNYYVFDWQRDTLTSLKEQLTQSYDSVGIIQHNYYESKYRLVFNASESIITDVNTEDPELLSWTDFIQFLQWMHINCNITAVDLFACDLWSDNNWKYIIQTIMDKYNFCIRSSVNTTGEGGDFILESDNFDTIGIYFTEGILKYKYAFTYQSSTSFEQYGNYKYTPYVLHNSNPGILKDSYRVAATGITFPTLTSDISNVKFVVSNGTAAVARLITGKAVIVGSASSGGNPSQTVKDALNNSTNVVKIICSNTAFSAIYVPSGQTQRRVIHWGYYGASDIETIGTGNANFNNISTVDASLNLTDISDIAMNSAGAFVALNVSGQIYTWGDKKSGGDILSVQPVVSGGTDISVFLSGKVFNKISAGNFHFGAVATTQDGIIWGVRDPSSSYTNGSFFTSTTVQDFYFTNTQSILCSGFIQYSSTNINLSYTTAETSSNVVALITGLATTTPIFTLQRMAGGRTTATTIPNTSETWVYLDQAKRLRMFVVSNTGTPTLVNDISNNTTNFFSATPSVVTYKSGSLLNTYATTADANVTNNITNYTDVNGYVPLPSATPTLWYKFDSGDATSTKIKNYGSSGTTGDATLLNSATISTTTVKTGTGSLDAVGGTKCLQLPTISMTSLNVFTFSMWVYTTSLLTGNYNGFFAIPFNYNIYSFIAISTVPSNNGINTPIYFANGGYATITNVSLDDKVNKWMFVAFSCNGTSLIYNIDGTSTTIQTAGLYNTTTVFPTETNVLGAGGFSGTKNWNGYIDNFRYYNSSLSAADLTSLYNESPPVPGFVNFNSNRLIKYIPSTQTIKTFGSGVSGTTVLTETYTNATDIYTSANVFAVSQTTPSQYTIVEAITNANNKNTISKPAGSNVYFGPSGKGLYALEIPNIPILSPKIIPNNVSRTINYYVSNPDLAAFRWSNYALSTSSTSLVQVGKIYSTYDNLSSTYTFTDVSFTTLGKKTLYIRNIDPDLSFNVLQFDLSVALITPVVPSTMTLTKLTSTTMKITVTQTSPPESYFAAGIGYYYYAYTSGIGINYSTNDSSYTNLIGMITDDTYPEIQSTITGLVAGNTYTFYVRAKSSTGGASSTSISQTIVTQPLPPTSVTAVPVLYSNKVVRLSYSPASNGTYYYTTDNSENTVNRTAFPIDASTIDISNVSANTTYYVIASNSGGNSISTGASVTPYLIGSKPTLTTSTVLNSPGTIKLEYFQTTTGTMPVAYSYSTFSSGTPKTAFTSNPMYVSGVTGFTTYYVVADNSGGTILSDGSTITPYLIGSAPSITSITPIGPSSVSVEFTQSSTGNGTTVYYYGFSGSSVKLDASATISPLVITGLSNTIPYSIYVVASNEAGDISSNVFSPITIIGSKPTITGITKNIGNSVTVAFTQTQKGPDTTVYYYSLDGSNVSVDASSSGTSLTIPNLNNTTAYNISIVARNPAGDVFSDASSNITVKGTKPTISTITKNIGNSVTVTFDQSQKGTDNTIYYGSLDGSNIIQDASSTTLTPITISNLNNPTAYSIYVIARNPAGDVSSNETTNVSILGNTPSFTLVPQTNNLKGTITHTSQGTSPVKYYYSSNSVNKDFEVAFPTFDISGREARTFYIIADNSAGPVVSSQVSGTPYIFGDLPIISPIVSGSEKLTVSFSQQNKGTMPVRYYYSFDSSGTSRFGPVNSPFDISGDQSRTVYIVADNSAGTLVSQGVFGDPYIYGSQPIITLIQRGSEKITVTYSQQSTGTLPVRYYYSFNRSTRIAEVTGTPTFDISTVVTQTVSIIADNSAGTLISADVSETPYTFGSVPVIQSVTPGPNKLTVIFKQDTLGNTSSSYSYSFDSSGTNPVSIDSSNTFIVNGSQPRIIYVIATNSAGRLISDGSLGTPYIFGTTPVITNVQPGTNSLTFTFNPSTGGTTPISYFYSYDSSGTPRVGPIQSGSFTITDISAAKTVYVVAENPAGNLVSNDFSGTPYIFGDRPSISSVTPGTNNLFVNFSQTNKGTLPVTYYYSFNGSEKISVINQPSFNIGGSIQRTLYVIADNSAGTIVSAPVIGMPYVVGDAPTVSITPGLNKIRVSFTQSSQGTSPVIYYYSYLPNGLERFGPVTSPFDISNITASTTIYIIANNVAGNVISAPATGSPFLIGNQPEITSITPGVNSLIVNFTGSMGGVPSPSAYYYSLDDGNYVLAANTIQSPILIQDLIALRPYKVTLKAENSAGLTLPSNTETGIPKQKDVVAQFSNTYVAPRSVNSESGNAVSRDRKSFINATSGVVDSTLSLESQQEYLKLVNKKRIGSTSKLSSGDIVNSRRVNAIGRASFK